MITSCGQRYIPVARLQFEEEIFDHIHRQNLRGLSTWQLVAEQQSILDQVEDWESIQSIGGMVDEELRQAVRYSGMITAEVRRRESVCQRALGDARQTEVRGLKERCIGSDFVDVVGHYVEVSTLSGSYKFKCPIHGDDHPSGQLYPVEGKWWCFGCNRGGDVFQFLMDYGRLSFKEAAALLGRLYGLTVGRKG